jgi:hypothetical protein
MRGFTAQNKNLDNFSLDVTKTWYGTANWNKENGNWSPFKINIQVSTKRIFPVVMETEGSPTPQNTAIIHRPTLNNWHSVHALTSCYCKIRLVFVVCQVFQVDPVEEIWGFHGTEVSTEVLWFLIVRPCRLLPKCYSNLLYYSVGKLVGVNPEDHNLKSFHEIISSISHAFFISLFRHSWD